MSAGSRNERIETVVVGAGQAGLSVSSHLSRRGLEHVVLERGRVGETWRSQRWDSFYLNTPNWTLQLPGFAYAGPEPDAFASLGEVIEYLEQYARGFDSPVREQTPVERMRRERALFPGSSLARQAEIGPLSRSRRRRRIRRRASGGSLAQRSDG